MPRPSLDAGRSLLARIGPSLFTVCVVIGPGSLLTSTRIGARFGYDLIWVLLAAVVLMMVLLTLGARLGVLGDGTPGELVTRHFGRFWTAVIGISVFLIASIFQAGNDAGVLAAIAIWRGGSAIEGGASAPSPHLFDLVFLVLLNAAAIGFLLAVPKLYRPLERIMIVFVAAMLLAFAANLFLAPPDPLRLVRGLLPGGWGDDSAAFDATIVIGWIGTTCIPAVAWYQGYLVRQKGWGPEDLARGTFDSRLGAALLGLITLAVTITAAEALAGRDLATADAGAIGAMFEPTFGPWGRRIFAAGLFSAAYSSFLVNASIGGFLLADGLGLGARPEDFRPRCFAVLVLLLGMLSALANALAGWSATDLVVIAQALTVVVSPLLAVMLLALTNRTDVMGSHRNGPLLNTIAAIGVLVLVTFSVVVLVTKVLPGIARWWPANAAAAQTHAPVTPMATDDLDEPIVDSLASVTQARDRRENAGANRATGGSTVVLQIDRAGHLFRLVPEHRASERIAVLAPNGEAFATSAAIRLNDDSAWLLAGRDRVVALLRDDGQLHPIARSPVEIDRWIGFDRHGRAVGTSRWGRAVLAFDPTPPADRFPGEQERRATIDRPAAEHGSDEHDAAERVASLERLPGPAAVLDLDWAPGVALRVDERWLIADAFGTTFGLVNDELTTIDERWFGAGHHVGGLALDRSRRSLWVTEQRIESVSDRDSASSLAGGSRVVNRLVRIALDRFAQDPAEAWNEGSAIDLDALAPAGDPGAILVRDDAILVAFRGTDSVIAIDPERQALVARHELPGEPLGLIETETGEVWGVLRSGARMARLTGTSDDASKRNDITETIPFESRTTRSMTYRERGERLFRSAKLSHDGSTSCGSCHVDGHSAFVMADTFGDGSWGTPKLTPSLLGTSETDPWGWLGNHQELAEQVRLSVETTQRGTIDPTALRELVGYLYVLEPPPPPRIDRTPFSEEERAVGESLMREHCGRCHVGPLTYTTNGAFETGAVDATGATRFNPPSLRGVAQRDRFRHDGTFDSLRDLLTDGDHPPGTSLTAEQLETLLPWLRRR